MEKNTANLTLELLLGTVTAAITTIVLGAVATGSMPIDVRSIVPERNPWLGIAPGMRTRAMCHRIGGNPNSPLARTPTTTGPGPDSPRSRGLFPS
jgi:hypothetical protein